MEARSRDWGQQALQLREALHLLPQPIVTDGSCAFAFLSIAMGGDASDGEKDLL